MAAVNYKINIDLSQKLSSGTKGQVNAEFLYLIKSEIDLFNYFEIRVWHW